MTESAEGGLMADPWAQDDDKTRNFRREVVDRLHHVLYVASSPPLQRSTTIKRCEDFLVELFQQARDTDRAELARLSPARAADPQEEIQKLKEHIGELHDVVADFDAATDPEAFPELHERAFNVLSGEEHTICRALKAADARVEELTAQLSEREGEIARLRSPWQPMESLPSREMEVFFWVVPKLPEEVYTDTSGNPIFSTHAPYLHRGKHGTWSSLSKGICWMHLPAPPAAPRGPQEE